MKFNILLCTLTAMLLFMFNTLMIKFYIDVHTTVCFSVVVYISNCLLFLPAVLLFIFYSCTVAMTIKDYSILFCSILTK